MERAIATLQARFAQAGTAGVLLREYPLSAELLAVTRVWRVAGSERLLVACKGAPETIARLCALDEPAAAAMRLQVEALAAQGARVLGVARATLPPGELPARPGDLRLQFQGIVGFTDPLRDTVPDAVRECRAAGIRVAMITGDHAVTARAIAAQAGIDHATVLSGEEIDALDDAALAAKVGEISLFARVTPAQKLRIVQALKTRGEVVAMTGDGVNDAPALKAAHIGIAMGGRGTDVAREAAAIVLLDDDFGSIVHAIRLGRRIYDNLRKAMGFVLAVHVPIAGLALIPVLLGWPLILTPMLIAMLELIIDPACSIVLEAEREERDVMSRPPRRAGAALLSPSLVVWSLLQGGLALLLVVGVLAFTALRAMPGDEVRGCVFLALVGANIALIFVNRSFSSSMRDAIGRPNAVLWWGLGIVAVVLGAIFAMPPLRRFFGLSALTFREASMTLLLAAMLLVLLQLAKRIWRRGLRS
jgi:Ca2+-transporting ATPase